MASAGAGAGPGRGRPVAPWLKQALELGPPLLFFVIYLRMQDRTYDILGTEYSGFIVAAAVFVPILLAATGTLWWLSGAISRMQVFTLVMVVFFGGLTVWFNDEAFFKMKTTLVYGFFCLLLSVGLLRGQSWLKPLMGEYLPMNDEGWMILTRRLALVFAAMAALNEVVWRTMSDRTWVIFETFGLPVALMAFLWFQIMALQRHMPQEDEGGPGAGTR
ncbi:inner membrane-spanning protein YciB [Hasllibacter halocynthiae]|nr:inner membrane-spanning protein YciB [Hasllibacter halocynthiae]